MFFTNNALTKCLVPYNRLSCLDIESKLLCNNALEKYYNLKNKIVEFMINRNSTITKNITLDFYKCLPLADCNFDGICSVINTNSYYCSHADFIKSCNIFKNIDSFKMCYIDMLLNYKDDHMINYIKYYDIHIDCGIIYPSHSSSTSSSFFDNLICFIFIVFICNIVLIINNK